ncbi:DNA topoisomerase 3-alpha [Teleopsis dalmanni]|uniref:DNA topoisomerase 3-alpha n=1 Tax=Teleopsis dalmanni TaxID=139649 RepID=UPI0018CE5CFF|nr:DNA topoisomerase 3-alpha [Teleopsis dalmanni]
MLKIVRCLPKLCVRNYTKKIKEEMKYLNVAEKNDAAKTIAGLLSRGSANRRNGLSVYNKIYDFETTVAGRKCKMVMTSVSGHLLHLEFLQSYRNWRNVDPQSLFDAPVRKSCGEDYLPIKRTLEREIRSCQGLIVWTDCDREGENIGVEIVDVCRAIKPNITVHRAIFSEITTAAVKRALQQLKTPDLKQSDAVDVRTELDLRTGAAITRFQTMRLQRLFPEKIAEKLISYGSCQIPTLGFVVERYKEIEAFVSEPFWKIKVIHTIDDLTVEFAWARNRLFDKQICEDYLLLCLADPRAAVENVTVKPKSKWRPTPMDTVEMEKLGSRKLKLSAKETMTIAEKLYTKGIISYPRTETNIFSKEIDLRSLVEQQTSHDNWGSFAQRVMEWGPNPRNGSKSDQAHPPIHPTKLVTDLQGNEARVYELICRHFLACVSKDATGSETIVNIDIAGEKFTATGLCIYERNYLDVYIYDKWNAKQIHKYEQGQVFEPTDISLHEGATTAPPLLTEADLISLMEKHGIGTDATHAEHINTIKERGYIGVIDKGFLVPGVIGMGLYEGYDAMDLALAKPFLRAEFESDLKKICSGEKDPKVVLVEQIRKYKEAYKQIMDKVQAMDEKIALRVNETPSTNNANTPGDPQVYVENNPNRIQELFQCPKCNVAPLALKAKKNNSGHFIGCLNFPDCKNVVWLPDECKEPSVHSQTCERCGSNVKLLKFKFSNVYYKTLFGAPNGWYKTCLRCDEQFRSTFNINLENIKNIGAIVSDTSTSVTNITSVPERSNNSTSAAGSSGINTGNSLFITRSTSDTSGTKQSKSKKTTSTENKPQPKKRSSNTTTTTTAKKRKADSNIRSYFTQASTTTRSTENEAIAAAELNDIPLDEFFDSNDGFEDIMLEAETSVNNETNRGDARSTTTTAAIVSNRNSNDNMRSANATSNSDAYDNTYLSSMFNDDSADFTWGTGEYNKSNQNPARTTTVSIIDQNLDDSFDAILRGENPPDDIFPWGTAERRKLNKGNGTKGTKPQQTVTYYDYDEHDDDDYNLYNGSTRARLTEVIKCTGCHQEAKLLTVKKNSPNQGREFYVCPKSNACKFFQWVDEASANEPENNAVPYRDRAFSSQRTTNTWGSQGSPGGDWGSEDRPKGGWGSGDKSRRTLGSEDRFGSSWAVEDEPSGTWGSKDKSRGTWGSEDRSSNSRGSQDNSSSIWGTRDRQKDGWEEKNFGNISLQRRSSNWETQDQTSVSNSSDFKNRGKSKWYSDEPTTSANANIMRNAWKKSTETETSVNCNCGKPASSLIVRKEGMNKGRPFHGCVARTCGFFKWADEAPTNSGSVSATVVNSNDQNTQNKKDNNQPSNKGRKCGLCRQQGHTKLKCPRKAEFEY